MPYLDGGPYKPPNLGIVPSALKPLYFHKERPGRLGERTAADLSTCESVDFVSNMFSIVFPHMAEKTWPLMYHRL